MGTKNRENDIFDMPMMDDTMQIFSEMNKVDLFDDEIKDTDIIENLNMVKSAKDNIGAMDNGQATDGVLSKLSSTDKMMQDEQTNDSKAQCDRAENNKELQQKVADDQQNTTKTEKNSLGKFKNPDELFKAYRELEKEFTKKSQKLKQMECEQSQDVTASSEFKTMVDKFFADMPSARPYAKDIANTILNNPELRQDKNCLNNALARVLISKIKSPIELLEDGEFLSQHILKSENVKNLVLDQYFDGLKQTNPPKTMLGGGQMSLSPKIQPKSISEAGEMFLKYKK